MTHPSPSRPRSIRAQAGVVLFIALIMLVALSLAGIALFRQVGAGTLIAGNLTFKTSALAATDQGIEAARVWLMSQSAAQLENANPGSGYYPGWCNTMVDANNNPDANQDGIVDNCTTVPPPSIFNPVTYNWVNSKSAGSDGVGNQVSYVIHRMCATTGSVNGVSQACSTMGSASTGASKTAGGYGGGTLANTVQPYFRITARALGPKNTVAFSQAIVY